MNEDSFCLNVGLLYLYCQVGKATGLLREKRV